MWMADPSAEPEIFRRWARTFQQDCTRQRWIPRCELIDAVTHALQWGTLAPPKEIGWIGFDRETPAEQALRAALEARGAAQRELTWEINQHSSPVLYTAQSERDETTACAEWVRARLAAHPESRIGILMPDLASRRAQLERELYRILSPARFAMSAGPAAALPFEFSLGQPLAQVPLVHAALLLLRWLRAPLTQQEISWLLLSSTLGAGQSDRSARCAGATRCKIAHSAMRSARARTGIISAPVARRRSGRRRAPSRPDSNAAAASPRPATGHRR